MCRGYLVNRRIFCIQTSLRNATFTVPLLFTDVNIYTPLSTLDKIKMQYFHPTNNAKVYFTKRAFNILTPGSFFSARRNDNYIMLMQSA